MTGQQLFDRIIRRMASGPPQTIPFLDALNDVLEIVGQILLDFHSNMMRVEKPLSIAVGKSVYPLPENFWGVSGVPFVKDATSTSELKVASEQEIIDYANANPGRPSHYEIIHKNGSDSIRIYPVPDAAYPLTIAYNIKPTIDALSDDIPWGGLFDSAVSDVLIRVGNSGGWTTISQDWPAIEQKVNWVLRTRSPRRMHTINVRTLWR